MIRRKKLDPFRTNFSPGMPLKSKKTGSSPVQTIPSSGVYKHSSSRGKSLEDNLRVVSEALAQHGKGPNLIFDCAEGNLKGKFNTTIAVAAQSNFILLETDPFLATIKVTDPNCLTSRFCLFLFVIRGSLNVINGAESLEVSALHFVIVDPREPAKIMIQGKAKLVCFLVPQDYFFTHVGFSFSSFVNKVFGSSSYEHIFAKLFLTIANSLPQVQGNEVSALCDSLLCAFRPIFHSQENIELSQIQNHKQKMRTKAVEFMSTHLKNPDLTAKEIALHLGISTRFLTNIFREIGTSPIKHLYELRLRKARVQLKESHFADMSIKTIADMNGFSSQAHFSKSFKKMFGMSPSKWRRF